MTSTEMITLVRNMTDAGIEDTDDILLAYLNIAGQEIINRAYPYDDTVTDVPSKYEYLQCRIAAYMLNKRGAEGETIHIENGVHRQYVASDIPTEMLSQVVPMIGVI